MAVLKYRAPDGSYQPVSYGSPSDLYLKDTGGTLSGPLLLPADPTDPLGAATRQYADRRNPMVDLRVVQAPVTTAKNTLSYTSPFPATNDPALWSPVTPTLLLCPWTGMYRLEGAVRFDGLGTSANIAIYTSLEVLDNGSRWFLPQHALKDSSAAALSSFTSSRYCQAGDEVTIAANGVGIAASAVVMPVSCVVWTYEGT